MPLNSRMQLLLGATGPVSLDGTVIYEPRGISPVWLQPHLAAFSGLEAGAEDERDLSKWHLYQQRVGESAVLLHPRGANRLVANESGQWYAWQAGYGLYTEAGKFADVAYPYACGPNGELVYGDASIGTGIWVMTAEQVEEKIRGGQPTPILSIPGVLAYDVRSYGGPLVSWRGPDAFTAQLAWQADPKTWRRPLRIAREPLYGIVWMVLAGSWWIGYTTGPEIRLRSDQIDTGIVVDAATPDRYYALDFKVASNGECVTGWASGEGQFPREGQRRVTAVMTEPRVRFVGVAAPPPPAPPAIPPPAPAPAPAPSPVPPKETSMQLTDREQEIVLAFAAKFPVPQIRGDESQDAFEERVRNGWTRKLAEQMAFSASPDFGMKARPGGGPISKDKIARNFPGEISERWERRPHFEEWDILIGTGSGRPTLKVDAHSEDVSDQAFVPVTPRDHLGAGGGVPAPGPGQPPTTPPPQPTPTPVPRTVVIPAGTLFKFKWSRTTSKHYIAAENGGGGVVSATRFVGMIQGDGTAWTGPGEWEEYEAELAQDITVTLR